MGEQALSKAADMNAEQLPITAICMVADRNKVPVGFSAILKSYDESADGDLWRESSFSLWSRPVRYIAVSREVKNTSITSGRTVVTDLTIVKENEAVPHGYVAVDYTADSREKALRKRFLCVKTEPLDSCVDAISEIVLLTKTKKLPKNFSLAGEVDGIMVCFKTTVIPPHYGMRHSQSEKNLMPSQSGPTRASSAYPQLEPTSSSATQLDHLKNGTTNAFTIKGSAPSRISYMDGVNFVLDPRFSSNKSSPIPPLPDSSSLFSDDFNYSFQTERAILSN